VSATEALQALQQLKAAEGLLQQGEYAAALQQYTALVQQHPDLALTEYARLGQAICMYQVGS
jgi:outer membrane protein assembly factor BamD (BamD/ComL family)